MEYKNKPVTIFGAGKSGLAAAEKLTRLGAKVMVTEEKPVINAAALTCLRRMRVHIELGGHSLRAISGTELIVVSPGVHLDLPVLLEARTKGIPIISEVELAYQFFHKPVIAITGTNGKTTTTALIGEMLKAGGKKAAVGGNIGKPLVEINDRRIDFIVAEISSYQLEAIDAFKPWISLLLNIQPDHLERHHSMEEYMRQKARIFMNQTGDDYLIYNLDDQFVPEMVKNSRAKLIAFSKNQPEIITLRPDQIRIPGRHNLENALAAAQAAYLCGVSKEKVAEVLLNFPGVEHRIEFVRTLNQVEFYNDSKGTNPDSTMVAIDTFEGKGINLILGGKDKGVPLEPLAGKIKEKVKNVILIGEAAGRFESALRNAGFDNIHNVGASMEAAVKMAFSLAVPGEIVLLSPACASFDMFKDFEERGRVYKQICSNLK